ncbi:MAG TPA: SRPBCC family protein [Acidimicrobiales bacterium]|nr:SRPBCC family protein [Acidimicrobiales bacterium]
MAAPVIDYGGSFRFDLAPDELWARLEEVDQFEGWWPWLTQFRLEGEGLSPGSVLSGVVTPPLPYRMRLRVELIRCERARAIDARVEGDLTGEASLRLRPDAGGTQADVGWTVEMQQPAMRLANRVAHPVLQWGHDRVVEITVAGFRRRIEGPAR